MELEIGDAVIVPEPNESDLHAHSFQGTVIDIRDEEGLASVEDMDGNIFDIEVKRLKIINQNLH